MDMADNSADPEERFNYAITLYPQSGKSEFNADVFSGVEARIKISLHINSIVLLRLLNIFQQSLIIISAYLSEFHYR